MSVKKGKIAPEGIVQKQVKSRGVTPPPFALIVLLGADCISWGKWMEILRMWKALRFGNRIRREHDTHYKYLGYVFPITLKRLGEHYIWCL